MNPCANFGHDLWAAADLRWKLYYDGCNPETREQDTTEYSNQR